MPRQAAIDIDQLQEKTLDQITAADFLAALDREEVSIAVWPEKKKLELHTEPEAWNQFRFRDVFDVIRNEKKKYELEKLPGFERVRDPLDAVINPAVFDRLVDRLSEQVAERLQR